MVLLIVCILYIVVKFEIFLDILFDIVYIGINDRCSALIKSKHRIEAERIGNPV